MGGQEAEKRGNREGRDNEKANSKGRRVKSEAGGELKSKLADWEA